jgi:hypothetical protein
MNTTIEGRLEELKTEHRNGQRLLADLDARRDSLQATLLRIGGAIQVLEELASSNPSTAPANPAVLP